MHINFIIADLRATAMCINDYYEQGSLSETLEDHANFLQGEYAESSPKFNNHSQSVQPKVNEDGEIVEKL